jgi:hypothetical protein
MEAMLYDPEWGQALKLLQLETQTLMASRFWSKEGALPEETDLWDTPANAWPLLLSVADMYQVERLKLHYA